MDTSTIDITPGPWKGRGIPDEITRSLERDVKRLKKQVTGLQSPDPALASLRAQELEERKRRAEWEKTRDIARGVKWVLENVD